MLSTKSENEFTHDGSAKVQVEIRTPGSVEYHSPSGSSYHTEDGFGTSQRKLANTVPDRPNEVRADDGTNFVESEYAFADTTAGVWRAFSDPANNTVAY